MTSSVRSLVRKSVFTVWGGLGSTSNPTLSQLSAKERDAKLFKEERRAFRSMKEREELQIQDGASRMLVETSCTEGSIQKPGNRAVAGQNTGSGIYIQFSSALGGIKNMSKKTVTKTQIQIVAELSHLTF